MEHLTNDIASYVDATFLRPSTDGFTDFKRIVGQNKFASIVTFPMYAKEFDPTLFNLSCVVGYPYGIGGFVEKEGEVMMATQADANEIDFVFNPVYIQHRDKEAFDYELDLALTSGFNLVKFIIECRVLTEEDIKWVLLNLDLSIKGQGLPENYLIKNSTGIDWKGFSINILGQTEADILNMDRTAKANGLMYKFKAAGGISSPTNAADVLWLAKENQIDIKRIGMSNIRGFRKE